MAYNTVKQIYTEINLRAVVFQGEGVGDQGLVQLDVSTWTIISVNLTVFSRSGIGQASRRQTKTEYRILITFRALSLKLTPRLGH